MTKIGWWGYDDGENDSLTMYTNDYWKFQNLKIEDLKLCWRQKDNVEVWDLCTEKSFMLSWMFSSRFFHWQNLKMQIWSTSLFAWYILLAWQHMIWSINTVTTKPMNANLINFVSWYPAWWWYWQHMIWSQQNQKWCRAKLCCYHDILLARLMMILTTIVIKSYHRICHLVNFSLSTYRLKIPPLGKMYG